MSGILSSEKRTTYRILSEEFPEKVICDHLWRYQSFLPDHLEEKLKKFNSLDKVSDEKLSNNSRSQSNNLRRYFQIEGRVYSIFESIFFHSLGYHILSGNYAVFLISNEEFSGAIIKNGEITNKKYFANHSQDLNGKKCSRSGGDKLLADISTLLNSWQQELSQIQLTYIHGSKENEKFIREEINSLKSCQWQTNQFQRIPFVVNCATLEELARVWEKLFSVVEHGSTQTFIKALESGQFRKITDITEGDSEKLNIIESTKQERRAEKQRWPGITPQKKLNLNEALNSNHYERLQDLVDNDQEIIDYLSTTHEKLSGQTYMHYAVKEDLNESVELLLNVGCDPTMADDAGKVPYDYAKSTEIKQIFVDFKNENSASRQWNKAHIPEEIDVLSQPKSSQPHSKTKYRKPKAHETSLKNKKQMKHFDIMGDEYYDEYDYMDEEEKIVPVQYKSQNVKKMEAEKKIKIEELEPESKLKIHSLLDDEFRPTEFQYVRSVWMSTPLKNMGNININCKQLRTFLENRMQLSVKTWFSDRDVLYSGYNAILGDFNTLYNRAMKPHVVMLINDEYFAGSAYDSGKACRRKTLFRSNANWTKIRDFTKGNLIENRFIEEKLSNCIQDVLNYWTPDVEIKVLYSCFSEFEWALKEHVLEFCRFAKFECIPFVVKNYTIPEVNKLWKKITSLTEHGQPSTFKNAIEVKNYEKLEKILDDPTEVVLPFHKENIIQELTDGQRKEIHKTILKNNYEAIKNVAGDHHWYIDYLKRPHAKFGGQTFLQFSKREDLDQVVKFLLEKGCTM